MCWTGVLDIVRVSAGIPGLTCIVLAWAGTAKLQAHPGAHMGLKISINDERVSVSVLLSNDFSRQLIPDQGEPPVWSDQKGGFVFKDEQRGERIREEFADLFAGFNSVLIDDEETAPVLEGFRYVQPAVPGLPGLADTQAPDVELDLAYPCKSRPKRVSIIWELYPRDPGLTATGQQTVTAILAELDAYSERQIVMFSRDEPEVVWHATGKPVVQRIQPVVARVTPKRIAIPLASTAVGGAWLALLIAVATMRSARKLRKPALFLTILPLAAAWFLRDAAVKHVEAPWSEQVKLPDEAEAVEIFSALHANIYKAFDFKTESDIYDVLAQSVDGDLLDQVYNEVYQGLIMRDQGGALARVYSVNIKEAEMLSTGRVATGEVAFKLRCLWQVDGVVSHWGHFHSRTNEYQAVYTVAQLDDNWKITGAEVLEQRRLGDDEGEGGS